MAAVHPRQYYIEFGPWTVTGAPTARIHMTDLQSNLSYYACYLSTIKVGLMFSTGGFLTPSVETPENQKSLWFTNLVDLRVRVVGTPSPPTVNPPVMTAGPLHVTGAVWMLAWNVVYMLQDQNNQVITIRAVPCFSEPPDEIPPVRWHRGDPARQLHADMRNLLSRLQQPGFCSCVSAEGHEVRANTRRET